MQVQIPSSQNEEEGIQPKSWMSVQIAELLNKGWPDHLFLIAFLESILTFFFTKY